MDASFADSFASSIDSPSLIQSAVEFCITKAVLPIESAIPKLSFWKSLNDSTVSSLTLRISVRAVSNS